MNGVIILKSNEWDGPASPPTIIINIIIIVILVVASGICYLYLHLYCSMVIHKIWNGILQCTLKSTCTWPNNCINSVKVHTCNILQVCIWKKQTMPCMSNNINYWFLSLSHNCQNYLSEKQQVKTVLYAAVKSLCVILPLITSKLNMNSF